jgi:hypothetical protein
MVVIESVTHHMDEEEQDWFPRCGTAWGIRSWKGFELLRFLCATGDSRAEAYSSSRIITCQHGTANNNGPPGLIWTAG